ncbi:MAG: methylated-DNA--[protein]-cysteine S-methyltransferase [Chlamydiae bacterium]|nr:methylated-DNA--[protein]-cysteine S-methyltransferase [Chlamydiota bacterium]
MYKVSTPLGPMVARRDGQGIRFLHWAQEGALLVQEHGDPLVKDLQAEIDLFFQGKLLSFHITYSLEGTEFQKAVWNMLLQIPFGQTRSYKEIAIRIGRPLAHRAVASACRNNPLALLIPCHRVIHTDGRLGGYRGGAFYKEKLLAHEEEIAYAAL